MSTNLDATSAPETAIRLHDLGYVPVPLEPGAKRPLAGFRGHPGYMCGQPTDDEVRYWWGTAPQAGIAVVAGEASHLVVVDVDPRNGGDDGLAKLEREFGPLGEPTTLTGGGGRHYWLPMPDAALPTKLEPAPGVEILCCGALAVTPPSIHPNGTLYRWARSFADQRETPEGWLGLITDIAAESAPCDGTRATGADTVGTWPVRSDFDPAKRPDLELDWWAVVDLLGIPVDRSRCGKGEMQYLRCPFHDDQHASMRIYPYGWLWACEATGCIAYVPPEEREWLFAGKLLGIRDLEALAAARGLMAPRSYVAADDGDSSPWRLPAHCPHWRPRRQRADGSWVSGPCGRERCPVCGPPLRLRRLLTDATELAAVADRLPLWSLAVAPDPTRTLLSGITRRWPWTRQVIRAADGEYVRFPMADRDVVVSTVELPGAEKVRHPRVLFRALARGVDFNRRLTPSRGWRTLADKPRPTRAPNTEPAPDDTDPGPDEPPVDEFVATEPPRWLRPAPTYSPDDPELRALEDLQRKRRARRNVKQGVERDLQP